MDAFESQQMLIEDVRKKLLFTLNLTQIDINAITVNAVLILPHILAKVIEYGRNTRVF